MPGGRGAGLYNVFLQCQKNLSTDDGAGQPTPNYQTQFSHWAQVVPRGGKQAWVFEQLRAEITHVVRLRFNSQSKLVLPGAWRFLAHDGTTLNVDGRINVDMRNAEFEFRCIEPQIPA